MVVAQLCHVTFVMHHAQLCHVTFVMHHAQLCHVVTFVMHHPQLSVNDFVLPVSCKLADKILYKQVFFNPRLNLFARNSQTSCQNFNSVLHRLMEASCVPYSSGGGELGNCSAPPCHAYHTQPSYRDREIYCVLNKQRRQKTNKLKCRSRLYSYFYFIFRSLSPTNTGKAQK